MNLSSRLTLAMITLVLGTSAAIGVLGYYTVENSLVESALERVATQTRARTADLDAYLNTMRNEVLALQSVPAHYGIIQARLAGSEDPSTEGRLRKRLQAVYAGQLRVKPAFAGIRFIGVADGGREIVRVDRSGPNGEIRSVADAKLQRKGDRPYFQPAIAVPPGGVYVSPVELAHESSTVQTPHLPVVRFAASLSTPDGQPFGFVIINLDLRPVFAKLRATASADSKIYVVNAQG